MKKRPSKTTTAKRSNKDIPIRAKLLLSHGLIAVLAFILAACGLIGISRVTDKVQIMYEGPLACEDYVGTMLYSTADLQRSVLQLMSAQNDNALAIAETEMNANVALMGESLGNLYASLTEMGATSSLSRAEQIGALIEQSGEVRTKIVELSKRHSNALSQNLYQASYLPIFEQIKTHAEALKYDINDMAQQYYDYSMKLSRILNLVGLVLIIIMIVSVIGITSRMAKLIATPVLQLTAASERMQQGDLSAADSITWESGDELGRLANSMCITMRMLHGYVEEISSVLDTVAKGDLTTRSDDITDFLGQFASIKESLVHILKQFNSTLTDIHLATEQVSDGSSQIAAGAQTLAQGAAEQASSVEEMLATMTDISLQVNMTAEHANAAMVRVNETGDSVRVCNGQMNEMMSAMDDITQKSAEISKIVKTIEDIAFQTNILALNAAVEAARAGAAGKGFAVVADEVRNLAAKSAEASQNTSVLINGTVDSVSNGTRLLNETAKTLEAVVEHAQAAAELVNEIADAANLEAEAISQVSTGLDQVSSVVQTTSATSEESASASVELAEQAQNLKQLIDQFRLSR